MARYELRILLGEDYDSTVADVASRITYDDTDEGYDDACEAAEALAEVYPSAFVSVYLTCDVEHYEIDECVYVAGRSECPTLPCPPRESDLEACK